MSGVSQFLLKRSPRTSAEGRRRGRTRQCSAWCQHGSRRRAVVGILPGRTHAVDGSGGGDGVAAAQRLVCKAHGVDFGSVSVKRGRHAGQWTGPPNVRGNLAAGGRVDWALPLLASGRSTQYIRSTGEWTWRVSGLEQCLTLKSATRTSLCPNCWCHGFRFPGPPAATSSTCKQVISRPTHADGFIPSCGYGYP